MTFKITQYAWFNWFDPVSGDRLVEIGALAFEAVADGSETSTYVRLNGDGYYLDVYGTDLEVDEDGVLSAGHGTRLVMFDASTDVKMVQWEDDTGINIEYFRYYYENDVPYEEDPDAPGSIFDASAVAAQPGGVGIGVYGANGGDDTMYGSGGADELIGFGGHDQIRGNGGDDLLWGDGGNDSVYGGAGRDDLRGYTGDDKLYGDDDDDMLWGEQGNDSLHGGSGADQLVGDIGSDKLYGDSGNDAMWGDGGKDTLYGGWGEDFMNGGTSDDLLKGGSGNDFLIAESGKDTLDGGSGHDWGTATLDSTFKGATTIDLVKKTIKSDLGTDKLISIENAYGGSGKDLIIGSSDGNALVGQGGKDTISGGGGDDTVWGGTGKDELTGGSGRDSFVFWEYGDSYRDHVTDFQHGYDKILLDQDPFFSLSSEGRLRSAYFVLGTKAKDSDDHIIYDKKSGKLYYDADGKGGAEQGLIAIFDSKPTISASDFTITNAQSFDEFWL